MTKLQSEQFDLFREPLFPVRSPVSQIDLPRFRSKLRRAMSEAIRQCPYERAVIAASMAQYLGIPNLTKAALDAYTAESRTSHDISLVRFKAFVRATGAVWLWDFVVAEDGLTLLEGDEARLAEIAKLQQDQREIKAKLKSLQSKPVNLKTRGRP
ncbi:hypothetical protein ACFSE0_10715 [Ochrobactrum teleogrylli]|uniref:Uncharacterized protein n=1 Tax=Ochrobactrum teleogrylli TaxID=2479765 RepID=A0ABY2Y7Q2_9HYPH|nr:hypothetical protein [[Ochrobactrum] teleogrylli]TNV17767.1 hypothetical protein FIC94_06220 [[Ochrobactrum] teleogrylli]